MSILGWAAPVTTPGESVELNPLLTAARSMLVVVPIAHLCVGCEMTSGNEPLLCACGRHSATYDPGNGQKAKPKWRIYSSDRPSAKAKEVMTRSQKPGALQAVVELCKGQFKLRSAASARAPAARTAQSTRQARGGSHASYDDTARSATRPAGPGRGHTGKRAGEDAVQEADRVLKKPKASDQEMRHALGRLTEEHKLLRCWCDKVSTRPYLVAVHIELRIP